MTEYLWAKWYQRRCPAKLNEKFLRYRGRCDLVCDHLGSHALERGMEVVEFKTVHEVKFSNFALVLIEREIRRRAAERDE